ncbi:MAG: ornithine cyclodeaminase family protein [Nitrososphaerales archaeon]
MVLILSRLELESLLDMTDVIGVLEQAFNEQAMGRALAPNRLSLSVRSNGGWLGIMPAYLEKLGALSTKIVTVFQDNPKKNLPTTMAMIVLNDPETGRILSVMDGGFITAMRTGGLGGLAAKLLSREDSQIAGIFGAGVQARTQLLALKQVRDITLAKIYDPVLQRAEKFAEEMREKIQVPIELCKTPSDVVKDSDIIVTVSTSKEPLFHGEILRPGMHLNAFGNFRANERELDSETVRKSRVIVDNREAALAEAGDLIIPIQESTITRDHIVADLGEIIAGRKEGRTSRKDITLFKSVGLGIQDSATAILAYKKALKNRIGSEIELS